MTTESTEPAAELRPLTEHDRFGRLIERRDGADFPFYNGVPVELSVGRWILVWASVVVGFLALVLIPQPDNFVAILPRALFVIIPLAVLALVAGRRDEHCYSSHSGVQRRIDVQDQDSKRDGCRHWGASRWYDYSRNY